MAPCLVPHTQYTQQGGVESSECKKPCRVQCPPKDMTHTNREFSTVQSNLQHAKHHDQVCNNTATTRQQHGNITHTHTHSLSLSLCEANQAATSKKPCVDDAWHSRAQWLQWQSKWQDTHTQTHITALVDTLTHESVRVVLHGGNMHNSKPQHVRSFDSKNDKGGTKRFLHSRNAAPDHTSQSTRSSKHDEEISHNVVLQIW